MKHEGPPGGTPYREPDNPNPEYSIEKMLQQIEAEKKFAIRLPEEAKESTILPLFNDAIKNNVDPKDIVFYSLATGILKYSLTEKDVPFKSLKQTNSSFRERHGDADFRGNFYLYTTNNSSREGIGIAYDKKTKTTKIYSFNTEKSREKKDKEFVKKSLISYIDEVGEGIKTINLQKTQGRLDNNTIGEYLPELKQLKTQLESLINDVENKLGLEK